MNYLAHALLSFRNPGVMTGNMLGDFVKGKKYLEYPVPVQKGILLHRHIDRFTDGHPLVQEAAALFRPEFRLSGGIFSDIIFDHFLANDPRYFDDGKLLHFTKELYAVLQAHEFLFDDKMKHFFFHMSAHNWLYHYRYMDGIARSIRGLCHRIPRLGDAELALEKIGMHFDQLKNLYTLFFPSLMEESLVKYGTLINSAPDQAHLV